MYLGCGGGRGPRSRLLQKWNTFARSHAWPMDDMSDQIAGDTFNVTSGHSLLISPC